MFELSGEDSVFKYWGIADPGTWDPKGNVLVSGY